MIANKKREQTTLIFRLTGTIESVPIIVLIALTGVPSVCVYTPRISAALVRIHVAFILVYK